MFLAPKIVLGKTVVLSVLGKLRDTRSTYNTGQPHGAYGRFS